MDIDALSTVLGAALGFLGAALSPYLSYYLEKFKIRRERMELAVIARAEHKTLLRHTEANLLKLRSLKKELILGAEIDYRKLIFLEQGLTGIELRKIYALSAPVLSQDVSRMILFNRNNDWEVESAIDLIFRKDGISDEQKWDTVDKLIHRMEVTFAVLTQLMKKLETYSKNPNKYNDEAIQWPDEIFQVDDGEARQLAKGISATPSFSSHSGKVTIERELP